MRARIVYVLALALIILRFSPGAAMIKQPEIIDAANTRSVNWGKCQVDSGFLICLKIGIAIAHRELDEVVRIAWLG
ncbi:hypothetical protein [Caballeronia arationis]|uniref:hypothetical protein n=1 Tax=Caballeronia arationis TaxID=1777142 RepID=UPI000BE3A489|nr:hypothetical protein [Caballeronia arationis]